MIDVACFDISQVDEATYRRLLLQASPERRARAERYLRREDQIRCVAAYGLIRYAVKKTLNISDFTVTQDAGGKPCILDRTDFHFNLSHSGRWVVIAYGNSPVGIDVQEIRMDTGKESIARRYFTAKEQEFVFQSDGNCPAERFFQVWTAKESYLKFTGTGLRRPLDSFCVVPDGAHLGVRLHSTFYDDYSMTLCTTDEDVTITNLSVQQLMKEIGVTHKHALLEEKE